MQEVDKNLTEPICKKPRVENENESSGTITTAPVATSCSVPTTVTATPVEKPVNTQESVNDGVTSVAATSPTTTATISPSSNPCETSDTNEGSKLISAATEVESVTESSASATVAENVSGTAEAKIS